MVITIRPEKGEPYQGVVALDKDNLADCLAHYFEVSEQIPTKIWLFNNADNTQVAGSLIQLLPDSDSKETQLSDFEHLCQLTNTIKADEIFSLDAEDLLYRLYHQEEVRLFEPQSVNYQCSCSEEKCLTAISQVSPSELISIIEEQGCVSMTCEYCLTTYKFDEPKLEHFIHEPKH
jgi:molecular chaperone Hsp33